jgi:hypothetical protein
MLHPSSSRRDRQTLWQGTAAAAGGGGGRVDGRVGIGVGISLGDVGKFGGGRGEEGRRVVAKRDCSLLAVAELHLQRAKPMIGSAAAAAAVLIGRAAAGLMRSGQLRVRTGSTARLEGVPAVGTGRLCCCCCCCCKLARQGGACCGAGVAWGGQPALATL